MKIQQADINHISEALTEKQSKSKYVSNEVDSKIWKLEDEIVLSQHQNNDEVNTRDCVVLKRALKEEAYEQRLDEAALIFSDVGQNRMKISNSDDSLITSDSQDISCTN